MATAAAGSAGQGILVWNAIRGRTEEQGQEVGDRGSQFPAHSLSHSREATVHCACARQVVMLISDDSFLSRLLALI